MSRKPAYRPVARPSSRTRGKRRSAVLIWAARLVAIPVLAWMLGLFWFSLSMPGAAPLAMKSDGVVVLTGANGRFQRGLKVLESGAADRMLISGVDRNTSKRQLAAFHKIAVRRLKRAELGYEAIDTRSNAEETARWVAKYELKSIRLVTSAGHMRRARLELARVLPAGVAVLPDAVPSEPKAPSLAFEYSKWLIRRGALLAGAA